MKKNAKAFFAVVCVLVVLLAGLFLLGGLRRSTLREQPPMTLEELDRLSEVLRGPEPGDERNLARGDGSMAASGLSEPVRANLPRRLNRRLTDEERREFFASGMSLRNKVMCYLGTSPAGAAIDAMGVAAGVPEGATANLGEAHLGRGNLDDARFYYTEFVRKSDNVFGLQMAYARLAWLEDDPELAARYLELGSSGPNRWATQLCHLLALSTGSIGLGEYNRLVGESGP